ncbi:fasciclin domain-containing protein [bacterium CPR1]|nr:fasciclin domain-containing protein [bacterium CPR1]
MLATTLVLALSTLLAIPTRANGACDSQANSGSRSSIVESAIANGQFTTLVAAVKAAGLAEALQGPGPFTVFAPTDAAFQKLPAGTLEALLANPEQLREVLTYHVVSGRVDSSHVLSRVPMVTLQGQSLQVDLVDGQPRLQGANFVATDIACSNGVIHVIDSVVLPAAR